MLVLARWRRNGVARCRGRQKFGDGDDRRRHPSESCVLVPSSSELGLEIATATGGSSSSTLRDRVVELVVVMIAGVLQVTVAINDNAGAGSWLSSSSTLGHRGHRRCCVKVDVVNINDAAGKN